MRIVVLFILGAWLLCSSYTPSCLAGDTLKADQKISGNETTLVSAAKKFELGFFSPPGSTGTGRYLGIWYIESEPQSKTVVWVSNRDNPVAVDYTGVFQIAKDGNLEVVDISGTIYWSSKLKGSSSSTNKTVKLMDSGNLVLLDDEHKGMKLWESFENPTDTFLPGMKMDRSLELRSWTSPSDPGIGNFTFKMDQKGENRFIILNQNRLYWESEEQVASNSVAKPESDSDDISTVVYNLLNNSSVQPQYYENKRLLLDSTGAILFLSRDIVEGDTVRWRQPKTKCLVYNACGNFASCIDFYDKYSCNCLPGFSNDIMREGDSSLQGKACMRRKSTLCGKEIAFLNLTMLLKNEIAFLNLTMVKTAIPDEKYTTENEEGCRSKCLERCPPCNAYSYTPPASPSYPSPSCWIWIRNLTTLKLNYTNGRDRRLIFPIVKSDIAPTPRTCEPCGTNIVPYPLSTGPNCGDLTYSSFSCNNLTGQLSFLSTEISYRVINVEPDSKKFLIHYINAKDQDRTFDRYCVGKPKLSPPFDTINDISCSDQVEVGWELPREPTCANSADCHGWKHSTCKGNRCLCDANYYWSGNSLSCIKDGISSPRVTAGTTNKGNPQSSLPLILGLTLTGMVILAFIIVVAYVCRTKIAHKLKQDKESIRRNRGHFYDSERHVKDLIDMEELEEQDNEGIEVPYFDFESIKMATDNFSDANKLGKGGYGPVYKGKLHGGQEIAVKRLSSVSSQGLQEFKNEVILIAKLQHRNLVRLRGYCIKGDEKILLYEYMPNRSLDSWIFDPTKSVLLEWQVRFDIILGIARGMLYLHQDSRLRVIHRDLKTSNILLDEEMQPKISDFGLARIFGGNESEASTERVVGTYGYMSPEYALDGQFSTKSDVFSFGVMLLEIISGKKNTGFYQSKEISSLLGHAWKLWREDKLKHLMDSSLRETYNVDQFIRCTHIGLLCVQDEPDDRPTMSNVLTMLDSETATLPTPKQPTFFTKGMSSTASSNLQMDSGIQEGR